MASQVRSLDELPVSALKGAGAHTLKRLEKLSISTVGDLLFHLPLRYEDRTRVTPIGQLKPGDHALVEGRVELAEILPKGRRSLIIRIGDGTGFLDLRFFHYTAKQREQLARGKRLSCYGEVRTGYAGLEMTHPDYKLIDDMDADVSEQALTPVYPLTEGIHQKAIRRLAAQALSMADESRLPDLLPEPLIPAGYRLPLRDALRLLHQPPAGCNETSPKLTAARSRLAFEELLSHHLSLGRFRTQMQAHRAPVLAINRQAAERFVRSLPFALTGAQQRVIAEIEADLCSDRPMMRLVQGDVGSGKTVVAAYAALAALSSNYQVGIMAPTELLAEQHFRNFRQWLEPFGVQIAFLSGRLKGEARKTELEAISSGAAGIVVGTHALFQEQVVFHRLGLIIIDEQHRFGVHQRLALREKGLQDGLYPHQLIMTATPIPRTLAMLGYADLDLSVIDERPPGRTPVKTAVIPTSRRADIIARITDWVSKGRQVYWVCTLIEESEVLQCEAAEKTAVMLAEALPNVRVALIHGRLKPAEKEAVMSAFKERHFDLLVATTVIEVGVDVPNASLMIIENAERLGLAQLHQLRGRVGRGPGEAHCVLLYQPPLSETARQRLGILRDSDDGFVIAEKDLELRGPGELLGTRQTGQIQFRIADLTRDGPLLDAVAQSAAILLKDYPDRAERLIRRWVGHSVQYAGA
ncbi:ATP-dependent DNA helicase RecG [Methylocaldum szegediense]|uniref:ATP-dependent DNA helicase RecG n=1 Tax=Methylocaldum szegediense TaxID=73780 RepID=A0ABM9HYX4_9GAMM|nr:ATP-dependent DNA helicase RecG [Methylocaldum szegediense]CAI8779034.1 ATP-dependent DNA helicase RecG [Methylocaldum szegediense]